MKILFKRDDLEWIKKSNRIEDFVINNTKAKKDVLIEIKVKSLKK